MRARARMLLPLAAAVLAAAAFASAGIESIDRFHRVDGRVALGGQPTPPQVAALAEAGFRAIVNLREDSEFDGAPEAEAAKEAEIRYLRIPVSSQSPADAAVEEFLRVTDEAGLYPVFIHCSSANRASAFWSIRRVLRDGWTLEAAEAEVAGLTKPSMRAFARDYIERRAMREAS